MACDYCTDENGDCWFPMYGVAPHKHIGLTDDPVSFIGSTKLLNKKEWPDNFEEDPDCPGLGTYYCPKCGKEQK